MSFMLCERGFGVRCIQTVEAPLSHLISSHLQPTKQRITKSNTRETQISKHTIRQPCVYVSSLVNIHLFRSASESGRCPFSLLEKGGCYLVSVWFFSVSSVIHSFSQSKEAREFPVQAPLHKPATSFTARCIPQMCASTHTGTSRQDCRCPRTDLGSQEDTAPVPLGMQISDRQTSASQTSETKEA